MAYGDEKLIDPCICCGCSRAELASLRAEVEALAAGACIHAETLDAESDHDATICGYDKLRAEVEELKVIISQWYSVYTDDMQPDGDLLADTDAVLRGEGEK